MLKNTLTGLNKEKLRRWLVFFFLALAIPSALLIQQSYSRLKWETFHQHQLMAEELSKRIDSELLRLINIEEARSFTDYAFLNVMGDPKANLLQRSPLSKYPIESDIAGLIGYFQVDNQGELKTPFLPEILSETINIDSMRDIYGISKKEFVARTKRHNQIQNILSQNSLVKAAPLTTRSTPKVNRKNLIKGVEARNYYKKRSINASDSKQKSKQKTVTILDNLLDASEPSFESTSSYQEDDPTIEQTPNVINTQIAFDRLKIAKSTLGEQKNKLGRIEDLKLRQTYAQDMKISENKLSKQVRKEQNVLPEKQIHQAKIANIKKKKLSNSRFKELGSQKHDLTVVEPIKTDSISQNAKNQKIRISTFESTIDPFEFSQLKSGHFVLFRNVWLDDKRYIQGLLIEQKPFLESIINADFRDTVLSKMSDLLVNYQGDTLSIFSSEKSQRYLSSKNVLKGELLYQTRLSVPLSELQLFFSVKQLPVGAGGKIILWLSLLFSIVLCAGFYLMYRLGVGQINLANQQQDFVSAVSHELKTPLTSIRMYSEILREGWVNDEKKKSYYDFIFDESERLSRLINNVLHLARVTRNKQIPEFKEITVTALIDGVRSKVSSQIIHAGFEFQINCADNVKNQKINVDEDWFSQIMINLVDNAIKFSQKIEQKQIDLKCMISKDRKIQFSIRDYGQGVDKTQMKKIFDLFYRTESELTRETVGTGIGLALVHEMMLSMNGKIDVINRSPGAEFRIIFPKL